MSAFQSEASFYPKSEWTSGQRMKRVSTSTESGMVTVEWDVDCCVNSATSGGRDSFSTAYPFIWLRDFCHCKECFDEASITKRTNLLDLDLNVKVTEASLPDDDGNTMSVEWSDGHRSDYPSAWLWCNRFHGTAPEPFMDIRPEMWGARTITDRLRRFEFDDLMTSDAALYGWMRELRLLGLTLVKNSPQNEETLVRLGERVGYFKETNFGTLDSVYAPTDPKNPIYTAGNLYFHTDLSYYQQQPGVELLHCIKQFEGVGGDSTLVDGYWVAEQMRKEHPELFQILTTQNVEFYQTGLRDRGPYFQLARNKVIRLNDEGELAQITYSNHSRTPVLRAAPEKVGLFYHALKTFTHLLYHPDNMYTYKMKPGDIIVIDNFRALHGRKGFEMNKGSERHLATAYLDWDLVYSRLRVLEQQLGTRSGGEKRERKEMENGKRKIGKKE